MNKETLVRKHDLPDGGCLVVVIIREHSRTTVNVRRIFRDGSTKLTAWYISPNGGLSHHYGETRHCPLAAACMRGTDEQMLTIFAVVEAMVTFGQLLSHLR